MMLKMCFYILCMHGSGFTLMHKARIWFMDICLGFGLSVTDRASVRHNPEIFVSEDILNCNCVVAYNGCKCLGR